MNRPKISKSPGKIPKSKTKTAKPITSSLKTGFAFSTEKGNLSRMKHF